MWWLYIPLLVLVSLILLLGVLVFLGRFRNGALLRPVVAWLAKFGFMRRFLTRMSTAAMERQNPELASAMRKMNTVAATTTPQAMQKAMNRLTPAERRAYFEATGEQQTEQAPNRQARRRVEKMQQQARSPGAASRKRKRR
jgi:hypothetical protein